MNKMLETVGAVHTHTHTHTSDFITKEKACNKLEASSCFDTQNLIRDG